MASWWWLWMAVAHAGDPVVSVVAGGREVRVAASAEEAVREAFAAFEAGEHGAAAGQFAALADAGAGPALRVWEAEAWLLRGELRRADRASELGVATGSPHAWAVRGLVLAELGRASAAEAAFAKVGAGADPVSTARVALGRCLVSVETGGASAVSACERASAAAAAAQVPALITAADANLRLVRGGAGEDPLGRVVSRLQAGDVGGARAGLPSPAGGPRELAQAHLAQAAVLRAEGKLDPAAQALAEALRVARGAGLVRESAAALTGEGVVLGLAGRHKAALQRHLEAVGVLERTHFAAQEVAARAEAGLSAVRAGDRASAAAQLAAARARPLTQSTERLLELEAVLAVGTEPVEAVNARFLAAAQAVAARRWVADEARICVAAVEAITASDEALAQPWHTRGARAFEAAQDPAGPAHLRLAAGLSYARAGQPEAALRAFQSAATLAEAANQPKLTALARENAALALIQLGHQSAPPELGDALARHERFVAGRTAYDEGLAAYGRADYTVARAQFEAAFSTFRGLGETGLALQARRGRAWAAWNHAVAHPTAIGLPYFAELEQEGIQIGDPELEVRAAVAYALGLARTSPDGAVPRLRKVADQAEGAGLLPLAAEVYAELAERELQPAARAAAARRAWALSPNGIGAYAMYSVAFAAFEQADYATTVALCEEVEPRAGDLAATVRALREAAVRNAAH